METTPQRFAGEETVQILQCCGDINIATGLITDPNWSDDIKPKPGEVEKLIKDGISICDRALVEQETALHPEIKRFLEETRKKLRIAAGTGSALEAALEGMPRSENAVNSLTQMIYRSVNEIFDILYEMDRSITLQRWHEAASSPTQQLTESGLKFSDNPTAWIREMTCKRIGESLYIGRFIQTIVINGKIVDCALQYGRQFGSMSLGKYAQQYGEQPVVFDSAPPPTEESSGQISGDDETEDIKRYAERYAEQFERWHSNSWATTDGLKIGNMEFRDRNPTFEEYRAISADDRGRLFAEVEGRNRRWIHKIIEKAQETNPLVERAVIINCRVVEYITQDNHRAEPDDWALYAYGWKYGCVPFVFPEHLPPTPECHGLG